jgi:hypothetical protein
MYISALEDRPIFVLDALLDVLLDALLSPPRSACTTKIMDEWPRTTCGQIQNRHSDGQVETPWSSASGIQIEHAANSLHPGPMRVAANDDVDPARDWIDLKCFDVVQDVDAAPAERYRLGLRIMLRPLAGIDVPSDRNDRRNPVESRDNVWRTDIAGVDDIRYACEELLNLRTQETVCVRDDSNSEHCASVLGARPYVLGSSRPITVGDHQITGTDYDLAYYDENQERHELKAAIESALNWCDRELTEIESQIQ